MWPTTSPLSVRFWSHVAATAGVDGLTTDAALLPPQAASRTTRATMPAPRSIRPRYYPDRRAASSTPCAQIAAMQAGAERLTSAMKSLEAAFLIGVEGTTEIWLV